MARDPKETSTKSARASEDAVSVQRAARRKHRGNGTVSDWSSCDSGKLRTAIANVSDKGFAVMLGYTRDRGSYTIRIVGGDEQDADYIRASEDIDYYLECLALDFE